MKPKARHDSWLIAGLCIWLLCAWVARQPTPARKSPPKVAARQTGRTVADTGIARLDPESGLALDTDLMLVKSQCTTCHSSKLIRQSHFNRAQWVERIRWMQRTQKLWDLGESEPAILTYLIKYYGPVATPFDGRRRPLTATDWHRP